MEPLEHDDPSTIGPYRLVARLGAGGMGRVYLARSAGGRTVAVKVVRADLAGDPEFRTRFRREVAAAQSVDGAYTAPVVDADRDSATPWLATAYVLGPSLAEAVARYGPLPEDSVRTLGAVLAEALASVHGSGLVHRDLKPSNVLLAADGPRLIDFGIARALDGDGLTSTGVVVGSPGFMSPEQAAGRGVGTAGDIFSLGSVLVFAATGSGPFGHDSAPAMLYRVVHEEPDLTGLPPGLAEVLTACLAKDPAQRPTPAQLARLLASEGTPSRLAGSWLPAQVASGIARHAAQVMEMETPAPRGGVGPRDPRLGDAEAADDRGGAADPGTVRLGSSHLDTSRLGTSPTAPVPGPATTLVPPAAGSTPSRRKLLLTALGVVGVVAAGGGTALALDSGGKPKPKPSGPGHHSSGPSAGPSPSAFPTRAAGVPPEPLWTFPGSGMQIAPVLAAGGRVYAFGDVSTALDARTGKVLWNGPQFAPGNMFATAGMLAGGFLIGLNPGTGDLFGLDPATGGQLWNMHTVGAYSAGTLLAADSTTAYMVGTDLATTTKSYMLAVDLRTRTLRWAQQRNTAADYEVAGSVSGGYLVYTNDQGNVVVRSTADGRQLWSKDFSDPNPGQPVYPLIVGDTLYVEGSTLLGFDLAGGSQVFAAKAPAGDSYQLPLVVGNRLFVQDVTGNLVFALNTASGGVDWQSPLQIGLGGDPAVAVGSTLFVGTNADPCAVYAFTESGGHPLWNFQDGQTDKDWYLSTDGTMLFAVHGDKVYGLPPV